MTPEREAFLRTAPEGGLVAELLAEIDALRAELAAVRAEFEELNYYAAEAEGNVRKEDIRD